MALWYFAGIGVLGCVTRGWGSRTDTLSSTFLVLLFLRVVGLWGNFDFFMRKFFDFRSGIGTVGWRRRTFSSIFLSKGLARVSIRLEAK
jgi:hypothetical protein